MLNQTDEPGVGGVNASDWCVGEPPVRWDVSFGARLAEKFRVAPPTVTEMLKRLMRDGYVEMDQKRQVTLTEAGNQAAEAVLRRHRHRPGGRTSSPSVRRGSSGSDACSRRASSARGTYRDDRRSPASCRPADHGGGADGNRRRGHHPTDRDSGRGERGDGRGRESHHNAVDARRRASEVSGKSRGRMDTNQDGLGDQD